MTEHKCFISDGHRTIARDTATPADLFDLAHDFLDRLDGLEWAFMCAVLIQMRHLQIVTKPDEPTLRETLGDLQSWLDQYRRDRLRAERDREFLKAPE